MNCILCGKKTESGWKFCPFCGYDISSINVSPDKNTIKTEKIDYSFLDELDLNDFEQDDKQDVKKEEKKIRPVKNSAFSYGNINDPDGLLSKDKLPVPCKSNIGKYYRIVRKRPCLVDCYGKMSVCLERNGVIETVSDNLMDYVFGDICIAKETNNYYADPHVVWNLDNLKSYALADNGIYYVKGNTIFFLDNTGKVKSIGRYDNIIDIKLDGNVINARIYKGMVQIAHNERRDECGDMFEAYYDVYQIHTEIKTLTIA